MPASHVIDIESVIYIRITFLRDLHTYQSLHALPQNVSSVITITDKGKENVRIVAILCRHILRVTLTKCTALSKRDMRTT